MQSIQPLSKSALAVFHVLTEGINEVGDHRQIDNNAPGSCIMAVTVEGVGRAPHGELIVSVAHYYKQNGDLVADPEVTFVVVRDDFVYPISYKQAGLGIDREYIRWEGDRMLGNLRMQNDLARFCTTWMRNIKNQQYRGRLPKLAATAKGTTP